MLMFRSTHNKLVKSLKEDFEAQLNAVKRRAYEQEAHDESRVQAEQYTISKLKKQLEEIRSRKITAGFNRDPRDVADTLVRALHPINRNALDFPNWENLPEEYRDLFYDIVYKLLGKPRKSSKKGTKHSI